MSAGATAEEGVIVSVGQRAISASALGRGIERCQRDAPELPIQVCIERFHVPLWRLSQESEGRFDRQAPLRREIEGRVLAERLAEVLLDGEQVEDAAVADYLRENQAAWGRPERLRLFRILLGSKDSAEDLIRRLQPATPAAFREAARKHSLDQTSHERGGDLGFVAADGSTDIPTMRVNPVLYEAARAVADGAFVPRAVPEGNGFAVVWRRGSLAEQRMSEGEARDWAAGRLREAQVRRLIDQIIVAQRTERRPDLLAPLRRSDCPLFTR
jgi:peptidyl-prolyl cis-trans isomerase C